MTRAMTVANLLAKKHDRHMFTGVLKDILGSLGLNGIWLIYGKDKNGKTWGTLLLSDMLSKLGKLWYISAEQGVDSDFQDAVIRAKIDPGNKNIHFNEYMPIEEISERLKKRNPPRIVVIDNLSMYKDELTSNAVAQLKKDFPKTLFIMVAHEERGEPYTAAAVMAKKLAKVIVRVQGLTLFVSGRCPGGQLLINEEKAVLFHGTEIKESK